MPEELRPLYEYASGLLQGLCRRPFQLGHLTSSNGEIFLRAMLRPEDHDELAYSDVYPALRAVLARWGAIHADAAGNPFRVRFNFYDRRNDEIEFQPAVAPAAVLAAAAARRSPRRSSKRGHRRVS